MTSQPKREFPVLNVIRCAVLFFIYVELFALALWLIPSRYNAVACGLIFVTLPIVCLIPAFRRLVGHQIFDRILLRSQVVEYGSGCLGESWERPYNEFRVHCLPLGIGSCKLYICLLYTSPSPRDQRGSRMPSSA